MLAPGAKSNPPRILVVDDSRMIRSMLLRLLEPLEAVVTTAENGVEALELAESQSFDLIISDIEMPRMDGFELCRRLKQIPGVQGAPIIILSTIDTEESIEKGFNLGVAAYVTKRNVNADLIPRIEEVMRRTLVLKGRTILLVDDSPFILKTLSEALRQAGLTPHTASDGVEALEILEQTTPDIIVSDVKMPRMDGAALCEEVKKREHLAHIPFLVMSVISDRRVMREMTGRGAAAYLVKPFNVEQLIMMSERLLSEHVQILLQENLGFQQERDGLLRCLYDVVGQWEARDVRFAGHSTIVAHLSVSMGRIMGFDPGSLEKLGIAAKLHDVGKVVLPDEIIYKPDLLDDEELKVVHSHPKAGADMLRHAKGLADVVPGVLHHHERMDGGGYPSGLTGESIPLIARIIAVADTYAALVSERPHRPAYSQDKAMQIVGDARGAALCPACVDAFMKHAARTRKPKPAPAAPKPKPRPKGKTLSDATILLVDNNRSFLSFLRRTLSDQGAAELLTAQDGRAAWDVINESPVDLVICDRDVPRLDGEELLSRVRSSEAFSRLPFIMTASLADKKHFKRALELMVSDYLVKPLTQNDFLDKVRKVLAKSDYMQGLESGRNNKEVSTEEFSNVLIEGVLQSHETLCSTATKRFRFHVRSLLANQLKPEHEPDIDDASQKYESQIRKAHTRHYINNITDVLHSIMDYQTGSSDERVVPGRRVRDISRDFTESTKGVFRRNLDVCLESLDDVEFEEEKIRETVDDFHAGYRNIVTRNDMRNIEILTVANRFNELKGSTALDQIHFLKEIHTPKMNWINLVDAFGRGLIEPIDLQYSIQDCDPLESKGKKTFPRVFCAPILKSIKSLIVGREKYNSINAIFLNKISQYCESKSRFEPDEVKDFFTQGNIRFYIASYLLYILKTLTEDKKRESFFTNVHSAIKEATGSDMYAFEQEFYMKMTSSWAMFIFENMSRLKSRKASAKILKRYIPEMFKSGEESQPAN